jgi:tRNA(fMet)-specific endonuclease VapC
MAPAPAEMLILDTDHFSELLRASLIGLTLEQKLIGQDAAVTIVTLDEQARGWLARVKQASMSSDVVYGYEKLHDLFRAAAAWTVLSFDDNAARQFEDLKRKKLRIGTMDPRNAKDFSRVSSLQHENWLAQ